MAVQGHLSIVLLLQELSSLCGNPLPFQCDLLCIAVNVIKIAACRTQEHLFRACQSVQIKGRTLEPSWRSGRRPAYWWACGNHVVFLEFRAYWGSLTLSGLTCREA